MRGEGPFHFSKMGCGLWDGFFRCVARDYRWVGLVAILARGEGPFKWDFGVVLGSVWRNSVVGELVGVTIVTQS